MIRPEIDGGRRVLPGGPPARMRDEARRLLDEAERAGLTIRLIGSLAVPEHCAAADRTLDLMGREPPRDIDFVGYSREQRGLIRMFEALGFTADPAVAYSQEYGIQRLIYRHPTSAVKVDVFLDVLRMSHTIDFRGRLPARETTVTLADLLLAKLQVHEMTEKDLQDIVALLATHQLGQGDRETIDLAYVLRLLAADWGLYYTTMRNFALARQFIDRQAALLPPSTSGAAIAGIDRLTREAEAAPKGLRWRARAAVGPRVRWYEDVEAVER